MAFRWTAYRTERVRSAVRAFNAAITRRTRELVEAGQEALVARLPKRTSVEEIVGQVRNENDFRRIVGYRGDARRGRTSVLTRILRYVNPDALEFVTEDSGAVRTEYAAYEERLDRAAIRRARRERTEAMHRRLNDEDEAFPQVEDMTFEEERVFYDGNDLMPEDAGEPDDSVVDVDEQTLADWQAEDAKAKRASLEPDAMVEVYLATWKNPVNLHDTMPGYQELIDALEWMLENAVAALNKMFDSGEDELDPDFITASGGTRNPYVNIPYDIRHARAVRHVTNKARAAGWLSGSEEGS